MENEIELKKVFDTYEELKEKKQLYYKCLNLDQMKYLQSSSLKYALFNLNLFNVFNDRITILNTDIEKLKVNLKDYKGIKIDAKEEMKKLEIISKELIEIEQEAKKEYDIYKVYLVKVAKNYDIMKNDNVKRIYIKSSEEIIVSRIKYYLNCEKKFIIFNDIIRQLLSFFNN